MELQKITSSSKPHPPVVGKVTHHSIELYWDLEKKAKRQGPQEQWFRFSIEEEDPKLHTYGIIYTGYATKHVVEGLEPRTLYRFRLKVTSPSGEYAYSPVVSVSTTREPISSEHLHRAVNVNDEDLLVRILQGGNVKVDVPNKFGFTALMVAAQRGYTRLVKILISHGTDVNLQNGSGKDSLMLACYAGHLDVVKYLRRHGASWDTRDLGGCTALHWAADGGHCNVIEWMIGDGCEVDVVDAGSRWTPLMRVSAVSGNQEVASLLIDAGADVNVKDKDGKTPLMVAVLNNHKELVQLLLDRGADASVKNERDELVNLAPREDGLQRSAQDSNLLCRERPTYRYRHLQDLLVKMAPQSDIRRVCCSRLHFMNIERECEDFDAQQPRVPSSDCPEVAAEDGE
uniref:Fibronectin type III and ankyrin repeat domains 1 n=1 Tax=Ovis aries TaxID=9940 RepID=A0AC11CI95_SHEEP